MVKNGKKRIDQLGEVMTPMVLVNRILDQFSPETWTDPTLTFLEPSAGTGNFIQGMYDRLMVGLATAIPDPIERHRHIFEHQIYAIEIQQRLVDVIIERFNLSAINHHIVCGDALNC